MDFGTSRLGGGKKSSRLGALFSQDEEWSTSGNSSLQYKAPSARSKQLAEKKKATASVVKSAAGAPAAAVAGVPGGAAVDSAGVLVTHSPYFSITSPPAWGMLARHVGRHLDC